MTTNEAVIAYRDAVNAVLSRPGANPDTDWGTVHADYTRVCNTIRAVLARHKPRDTGDGVVCEECGTPMPCGTRRTIGKYLGIEASSGPDDLRARLEGLWATPDGMIEIFRSPELMPAVFSEAARADGTTLAFINAYRRLYERHSGGTEVDDDHS